MIPVRLFTTMAMPVSKNGSLKSTTASRSAFIISDVSTISALRFIKSAIRPFHLPFSSVPHLPSSTRTSSYVKPAIRQCQIYYTFMTQKKIFSLPRQPRTFSDLTKIKLHLKSTIKCVIYPMVRQTFPINRYKIQSNTDKSYHFGVPAQCQCYHVFFCERKKQIEWNEKEIWASYLPFFVNSNDIKAWNWMWCIWFDLCVRTLWYQFRQQRGTTLRAPSSIYLDI